MFTALRSPVFMLWVLIRNSVRNCIKQVNSDVKCYSCRVYSICQKLVKHIYMENACTMSHKAFNWWCNAFFTVTLSKTDLTHDFIIRIPANKGGWCSEVIFCNMAFICRWIINSALSTTPNDTVTFVQKREANTVEFKMMGQLMMSPDLSALTGWLSQACQ